jgi:hypothetical protein
MVQQNRNIMTLMNVLAHASSLRRKRRGIYPQVIQTKIKTPRVIFMADDFYNVLGKAKELRDRDFPTCPFVCHINGKSFGQLRHGWNVACKRIGLEGKSKPEAFARDLSHRMGVDWPLVSQRIGWLTFEDFEEARPGACPWFRRRDVQHMTTDLS